MRAEAERLALWVEAADPLVRAALERALEGVGDAAGERRDADAWVWDLGGDDPGESWQIEGPPVLALVDDGARARDALADGAQGVIRRTVDPERLAPSVRAVDAGLVVIDERFAPSLLPGAQPRWEVGPLTPREQEVLGLLAEGLSNPELAQVLGVTVHTVKFHVNAILTKLDAATRTEAVVLAARLGLLSL